MEFNSNNQGAFKLELASQINRQHVIGGWVAIVVNTLWSLGNYYYFFNNNLTYLITGLGISCIILSAIILRKRMRISPEMLAMIPISLMTVFFAFTYSQLNIHYFSEFTLTYVAMFLGAGMFLLWRIQYSLVAVLITILANTTFFSLYSVFPVYDIMLNGGILVLSVAFFMIVSIQIRYNMVVNAIYSRKELIKAQEDSKKSAAQSRLLFNKNPRPMLIYSLDDLTIIDVNDTIIKDYGYTKEEFLQMKISDLILKEEHELAKKVIKAIKEDKVVAGKERKYENKVSSWGFVLKNGKKIKAEVTGRSISYNDKKARLLLIQDVTESKLIQKQLEETMRGLSDYKFALDAAAIVCITDSKGIITHLNDKFCEISQYTKKELLGKNHRIINSGHHSKEFWKKMWTTIGNGKIWYGLIKNKTKGGDFYWVDTSIIPFVNKNNKSYQYLVIRKDVTKDKLVQEQLEETMRGLSDYKFALDASSIVSVTDSEGTITYVNNKFCEVSGYTEKELLGKNHRIVNSGHHPKEFWTKLWGTIGKGKNFYATVKNKAKNGSFYWVDTSIVPFMDKNNKPYQYLVIRKEVTKAILIQEQLKESEKDHRLFFENNPIPMFVFSEKTQKILGVNHAMEDKYGYSKEDFLSLHLINKPLYENILKIINVNSKEDNEWSHAVKSGNFIIVKTKIVDILHKKESAKLVSLTDITKIKFHEMALEDAKRMAEEAKDHQSQFLSNMSHEIRTPMNGVLGMSRLLKTTKLTKEQRKYTSAIYTSADNLMHIINEILDFSKIEAGKLTIEEIPFDLRELAHIWEETLKFNADEKNIGFDINIDPNVPNELIGDPIRLNQIIYNLGGNAIKFTNDGKVVIDISVKKINKDVLTLQVDVTDNGIGIPEDKLEHIFSSFSQASSSTTRKYGGTGLGLTITKQLVELQDGEIWVESDEGKGSTFSFIINYRIHEGNNSNSGKNGKGIINKLGALNILLVEDHDINQMLATTVLEGWDFKVDLAENGEEAVEKVSNTTYDIILMDIHMPKMDGYEATRQIRGKLDIQTPVIAMTASAKIGDNKKCFEVGMDDYISKPFDPETLLKKITTQINKKPA